MMARELNKLGGSVQIMTMWEENKNDWKIETIPKAKCMIA